MTLKELHDTIEELIEVYGEDIEVKTNYNRNLQEPPYVDYNEELDCIEIH